MAKLTFTQKLRAFSGISLSLGKITANSFDGFGLSLLSFSWNYVNTITITNTYSLLSFNVYVDHERRKRTLEFRGNILGLGRGKTLWSKPLAPRMDICDYCSDPVESTTYFLDGVPYCSEFCQHDGMCQDDDDDN